MQEMLKEGDSRDELQWELCAVVDLGTILVNACYILEGDSLLGIRAYDIIKRILTKYDEIRLAANANDGTFLNFMPNLRALARTYDNDIGLFVRMSTYVKNVIRPAFQYLRENLDESSPDSKLLNSMKLFRAFRLFNPSRSSKLLPGESVSLEHLRNYAHFQGLVDGMYDECADYKILAEEYPGGEKDDPTEFFEINKLRIPNWYEAFHIVSLVQPSSCAAERVFSILNLAMGDSQQQLLADLTATIVMLRYNRSKPKSQK
jgi:hypothetical protein